MRELDALTIAVFIAGAVTTIIGIFIRVGRLRAWMATYDNPIFPSYMRNVGLAAVPYGVAFLLCSPIFLITDPWLSVGLFAASLLMVGFGIYVSLRAPEWSKPNWVKMRERDHGAPSRPSREFKLGSAGYAGLWILLAGTIVAWWILDLSLLALIAGLAFLVPVIAAAHGRRGRESS